MDFLIPANSKKSLLIFSLFTMFDLILFGTGIGLTLLLLLLVSPSSIVGAVIDLAPAVITGFLVLPIPNYHNTLTVIREVYTFYTNRQRFVWKGWCVKDAFKETKK
ncbi:MAG: hypothetical protein IJ093_02920 [Bacilli bacterium]|nr:hypothetical protein [Bacilli bacterium]